MAKGNGSNILWGRFDGSPSSNQTIVEEVGVEEEEVGVGEVWADGEMEVMEGYTYDTTATHF